jgi:transposase
MYDVHDWAEVHRLHHVEGMSKAAIAAKLSMSRTTVHRLLRLSEPPKYERRPAGSQVDAFAEAIAAMLAEDPKVPATVIAQRLRPQGFAGSVTILKDHLRRVRPLFLAAQAHQHTSYQPGELAQIDWWEPGIRVPVGRGQTREVFGLVTGLPFSAAFRVVFAFNQTVAAFCPALVGGLARLGGLPKAMVSDNDACIVASRRGGTVKLVDEVAGLYGQLGLKAVPLRPYFPQGKGYIERMNQFLETSFLPLRRFESLADLQAQADQTGRWRPPTAAGCGASTRWWPTRSRSNAAGCEPSRHTGPMSTSGWKYGRALMRSSGSATSTTPCPHGSPAAAWRSGPRWSRSWFSATASRSPPTTGPGPEPTWCSPRPMPASCARRERPNAAWTPTATPATLWSRRRTCPPTTSWPGERHGQDQ